MAMASGKKGIVACLLSDDAMRERLRKELLWRVLGAIR
jgi:hypothetical protein